MDRITWSSSLMLTAHSLFSDIIAPHQIQGIILISIKIFASSLKILISISIVIWIRIVLFKFKSIFSSLISKSIMQKWLFGVTWISLRVSVERAHRRMEEWITDGSCLCFNIYSTHTESILARNFIQIMIMMILAPIFIYINKAQVLSYTIKQGDKNRVSIRRIK